MSALMTCYASVHIIYLMLNNKNIDKNNKITIKHYTSKIGFDLII